MKKGFTLIELLLYVGMISVMVFIISSLFVMVLGARIKNQLISDVEAEGASAMRLISQTITNADSVSLPIPNNSSGTLNLLVPSVSLSPTIFDLSSGAIRIKEGSGNVVSLTSPRVIVSNLNFQNLSASGTPDVIRVSFTASGSSSSSRSEYTFTKNFYTSAGLRK